MSRSSKFIFALLLALAAGYAVMQYLQSVVVTSHEDEGATIDGLYFPGDIKMNRITQQLTGGGTRTKFGMAKVYAVALYVDADGAAPSLEQYAGYEELDHLEPFFGAVIEGTFAKTLVLQFHREVSSADVVKALNDAMSKRVSEATVTKFQDGMVKALGDGPVAKGQNIYLMCRANRLLIGNDQPKADAVVRDRDVCSALFDVYFGDSPISPSAKEGAARGFIERGFYLTEE